MSNSTNTVTIDGQDDSHVARDVFILTLNAMTTIVGVLGNVIVCKVVFLSKKMRLSPAYALMGSMSFSDILGALSTPGQWIFCSASVLSTGTTAEYLCAINKSCSVMSWFVSTLSMMFIAIDRYLAVRNPVNSRSYTAYAIAVSWGYSFLFVLFTASSVKIYKYFGDPLISCDVILTHVNLLYLPSHTIRTIRVAGVLFTQYVIPLGITGIVYGFTARLIWRKNVAGVTESRNAMLRKRRSVVMMATVVVVFALSWLPVHIIHFINFFVGRTYKGKCNVTTLYLFFWWMGITSCCFNPFIYFWMDTEFRREWQRIWAFLRGEGTFFRPPSAGQSKSSSLQTGGTSTGSKDTHL